MSTVDAANHTIELPPDLIVHDFEQLRQDLLQGLRAGGQVSVDASEVHRVGIVALQLLLAFLREARQQGVVVQLSGVRRELDEALRATGLDRDPDVQRSRH